MRRGKGRREGEGKMRPRRRIEEGGEGKEGKGEEGNPATGFKKKSLRVKISDRPLEIPLSVLLRSNRSDPEGWVGFDGVTTPSENETN